jgi:hypothetical protein
MLRGIALLLCCFSCHSLLLTRPHTSGGQPRGDDGEVGGWRSPSAGTEVHSNVRSTPSTDGGTMMASRRHVLLSWSSRTHAAAVWTSTIGLMITLVTDCDGVRQVPSAMAAVAEPSETGDGRDSSGRDQDGDSTGGNDDDATNSMVCQTQCANACRNDNGGATVRHGRWNRSSNRRYAECIEGCGDRRQCDTNLPPDRVREPVLVPSKPIPGLYSRWQDDE